MKFEGSEKWCTIESGSVFLASSLRGLRRREFSGEIDFRVAEFVSPVRPGKIVGVAENYLGVGGSHSGDYRTPLVFLKARSSLISPGEKIRLSEAVERSWGEPELGVIIRERLRGASPEQAEKAILGFTLCNDVTGIGNEGRDHHLAQFKSPDSYCAVDYFIDTSFHPSRQRISGLQDGIVQRSARLSDRKLGDAQLLSWISSWMTLAAGDIVLTGSPPRLGEKVYLRPGCTYSVEVEGLGSFESQVS